MNNFRPCLLLFHMAEAAAPLAFFGAPISNTGVPISRNFPSPFPLFGALVGHLSRMESSMLSSFTLNGWHFTFIRLIGLFPLHEICNGCTLVCRWRVLCVFSRGRPLLPTPQAHLEKLLEDTGPKLPPYRTAGKVRWEALGQAGGGEILEIRAGSPDDRGGAGSGVLRGLA